MLNLEKMFEPEKPETFSFPKGMDLKVENCFWKQLAELFFFQKRRIR